MARRVITPRDLGEVYEVLHRIEIMIALLIGAQGIDALSRFVIGA